MEVGRSVFGKLGKGFHTPRPFEHLEMDMENEKNLDSLQMEVKTKIIDNSPVRTRSRDRTDRPDMTDRKAGSTTIAPKLKGKEGERNVRGEMKGTKRSRSADANMRDEQQCTWRTRHAPRRDFSPATGALTAKMATLDLEDDEEDEEDVVIPMTDKMTFKPVLRSAPIKQISDPLTYTAMGMGSENSPLSLIRSQFQNILSKKGKEKSYEHQEDEVEENPGDGNEVARMNECLEDCDVSIDQQLQIIKFNSDTMKHLHDSYLEAEQRIIEEKAIGEENLKKARMEHEIQLEYLTKSRATDLARKDAEIIERNREVKMLTDDLTSIQRMEATSRNKVDRLANELKTLHDALNQTVMEKQMFLETNEDYKRELAKYKRELDTAQEEVMELKGNLSVTEVELVTMRDECKTLQEHVMQLKRGLQCSVMDAERYLQRTPLPEPTRTINTFEMDGMPEQKTCKYGKLDFDVAEMSVKDARKAIKDYQWPSPSAFTSIDTYVSAFHKNMQLARREGIPRQIIALYVSQHLNSKMETSETFARAQREEKTDTLEDIIEVLETLDPVSETLSAEERFQRVTCRASEPAITYVKRLEGLFNEIFKNDLRGKSRRIKKQFLRGFTKQGSSFNDREVDNLSLISDLVEMAMRAESLMSEKLSNGYRGQNRQTDNRQYNSPRGQGRFRGQMRQTYYPPATNNNYSQQLRQNTATVHHYQAPPTSNNQAQAMNQSVGNQQGRQINELSERQMNGDRQNNGLGNIVTMEEFENKIQSNGRRFCFKCLSREHVHPCTGRMTCVYCITDGKPPHSHSSSYHGNGQRSQMVNLA